MRGIMIQGTASDVGKSVLTTALCRLLARRGHRVAPFKAQTMSSHTVVIAENVEIGISQYEQAEASLRTPEAWMNPVLLKPVGNQMIEVFFLGKLQGEISGFQFKNRYYNEALTVIKEALSLASESSDYIMIEGAGSPVEMNLKERDLANMAIAELADVPVLLVADIERGGVFASIVGTLELLPKEERARVKGILINKFVGEPALFADGVDWIENKTGIPVLGVIPYIEHKLDEEDGLAGGSFQVARHSKDAEYKKLANHLEEHVDLDKLLELMDGAGR